MQLRPRVDVVMVTWNSRDVTAAAVRRLYGETDVDLRLYVHDNASSDGTADAVHAAAPDADVVVWPENVGFARGVNAAAARGCAPWLMLLNSDAWPTQGSVAALVQAAERHPAAALVAPRLETPDGSLEHSTHALPSLLQAAASAAAAAGALPADVARRYLLPGVWQHDTEQPVGWAVGAAWLVRRAAWEQIGRLDERFFMYGEDVEWCSRAWRMGYQVWFTPAAVVCHVGNVSGALAYGERRAQAALHNVYRSYREGHGALATAAYRGVNIAAALRAAAANRRRRQLDTAAYWMRQASAHARAGRGHEPLPEQR